MCSDAAEHRFVVDVDPSADALVRILNPFAVRQVMLTAVRHSRADAGACAIMETAGLSPAVAELLGLRLAQMPHVRRVEIQDMRRAAAEFRLRD